MCISITIYIALARSIPGEALDMHTMDEQSTVTRDKLQLVVRVQKTGPKMLHDGSFAWGSSRWVSVVSSWVFCSTCQVQVCSFQGVPGGWDPL